MFEDIIAVKESRSFLLYTNNTLYTGFTYIPEYLTIYTMVPYIAVSKTMCDFIDYTNIPTKKQLTLYKLKAKKPSRERNFITIVEDMIDNKYDLYRKCSIMCSIKSLYVYGVFEKISIELS